MVCIYCRTKTSTGNSRATHQGHQVWRRRICPFCEAVFTTRESVDMAEAVRVRTSENVLQPFSRDKLFISLYQSISHRKTALRDAGELSETTISLLLPFIDNGVLTTSTISGQAQEVLGRFDAAGAVYYRAHHTSPRLRMADR